MVESSADLLQPPLPYAPLHLHQKHNKHNTHKLTELELVGLAARCTRQELVAQADAEDRNILESTHTWSLLTVHSNLQKLSCTI